MATPPVYLDLRQLVSNLIDWTDPENPVLRTVAQVSLASAPYAAVSVGTSATPLVSAVDDTRKALSIYNNGTTDLYCGPDGSITTSNAPIVIAPGTGTVIEKSDGFARFRWYGIAGTGTIDARVMEGKE